MLWEKQACNLPELLAPFQEGIVLCVNSSWGRWVVITALGRMGGKEITFSLQSHAPFLCKCSLGLKLLWGLELRAVLCTLAEIASCHLGNSRGLLGVRFVSDLGTNLIPEAVPYLCRAGNAVGCSVVFQLGWMGFLPVL